MVVKLALTLSNLRLRVRLERVLALARTWVPRTRQVLALAPMLPIGLSQFLKLTGKQVLAMARELAWAPA